MIKLSLQMASAKNYPIRRNFLYECVLRQLQAPEALCPDSVQRHQ